MKNRLIYSEMNRLDRILHAIVLVLSIDLLYRLFSNVEFTRLDYIFMIILLSAGLAILVKQKYNRNKQNS